MAIWNVCEGGGDWNEIDCGRNNDEDADNDADDDNEDDNDDDDNDNGDDVDNDEEDEGKEVEEFDEGVAEIKFEFGSEMEEGEEMEEGREEEGVGRGEEGGIDWVFLVDFGRGWRGFLGRFCLGDLVEGEEAIGWFRGVIPIMLFGRLGRGFG